MTSVQWMTPPSNMRIMLQPFYKTRETSLEQITMARH